ncbi:SHOCT domain-containing protein [Pontibacter fetidus]|uniref:SHOCT domain-containing protein n=1 Tax=Pontibacter fetidus TaxID=2700082 RepID=A0A6B2HBV6_9BACT|nr:SHOCT domain-containing protein [Pontibacter fetidus]NDK57184.1 SHOCT domain-containing protein [Pontibacter fetidus]
MKLTFTRLTFLLTLTFLTFLAHTGTAQRLGRLMQERDQLYEEWEYYQDQNNAFFGGKSKDDLANIIGVQNGIIAKDNEIMEEVRSQNNRTEKGLRDQHNITKDQLSSAEETIANLRTELETTTELYNNAISDVGSQSDYKNTSFMLSLILLGTTVFLAFKLRKAKLRQEELSELSISSRITYDADECIARLEKIGKLKENGLITEEDFKTQKDKILAAM